jgi:hypothetical protein
MFVVVLYLPIILCTYQSGYRSSSKFNKDPYKEMMKLYYNVILFSSIILCFQ